jgi:hypothetical protein
VNHCLTLHNPGLVESGWTGCSKERSDFKDLVHKEEYRAGMSLSGRVPASYGSTPSTAGKGRGRKRRKRRKYLIQKF